MEAKLKTYKEIKKVVLHEKFQKLSTAIDKYMYGEHLHREITLHTRRIAPLNSQFPYLDSPSEN